MKREIKVGDIINYRLKNSNKITNFFLGLQRKFDEGDAGHSAIVASIHEDSVILLEMRFEGFTCRKEKGILENNSRQVLRVKGLTEEDRTKLESGLLDYYHTHKRDKYSYLGLISASLGVLTKRLFKKRIQLLPEEKKRFCSELVTELYKDILGIKLTKDDDITTPNMLTRSDKTEIIKDFKK